MVGYDEYSRGYRLFDPSYSNTFIERSVQFKEELMPELELAPGECSSPPPQDDVSDEYFYDIYDYDMDEYYYYVHVSPIRPKWAERTMEVAEYLAGNPLDPRKT